MIKILIILLLPIFTFGQSLFAEVDLLFKSEQYTEAETVLHSLLNNNPNEIKALELLGETYAIQQNWDEAVEIYKHLVEIDVMNANYHYQYGGAMGMKAIRSNKFLALLMINDIKYEFLKASELDVDYIESRWALVVFYMELPGILGGSKKNALLYSDALQKLSPVDGYLSKGYIYETDEDLKLAEEYYKKAIEIGGSITCFQKLTSFYENEGQHEKAISTIEEAHDKLQRNSLNYQLGKVCAAYNLDLDKGEKCLYKYINNHSPQDGIPLEWAYYRLAQIYKHKNDKIKAIIWINKSLATQSDFEPAIAEKKLILKM